jgi:Flp pilus assembly protein TadG
MSLDMIRKIVCESARHASDPVSFGRNESGIAATEFALVLPVALVLMTGAFIYGTVDEINRKVTITARTVTDLVARCPMVNSNDLAVRLNASAQIMSPFSLTDATVYVSEVVVPPNNASPSLVWSVSLPQPPGSATLGPGLPTKSAIPLPAGMVPPSATLTSYFIWGKVSYLYTPTIGYNILPPVTLSYDFFMNPRVSTPSSATPSFTGSISYQPNGSACTGSSA